MTPWKKKPTQIIILVFIGILLFLIDPFKWVDIQRRLEESRKPCTAESTRPTCTGKIKFFWQ